MSMVSVGYFLSCEEFGPHELVRQAQLAEQAGFERLWISDHYHPWLREQGQSPFVWSVIGALSQVTSLPISTAVTCPTIRIHPAIIAQAAATASVQCEGRFVLGVENAEVFTRPEQPVPIYVSGLGPAAARLAGEIGDGFCCVMPSGELVRMFRDAGGGDKPAAPIRTAIWTWWASTSTPDLMRSTCITSGTARMRSSRAGRARCSSSSADLVSPAHLATAAQAGAGSTRPA